MPPGVVPPGVRGPVPGGLVLPGVLGLERGICVGGAPRVVSGLPGAVGCWFRGVVLGTGAGVRGCPGLARVSCGLFSGLPGFIV